MTENTTEKEKGLFDLIREARTEVYKMLQTTDKQEKEKIKEQLREILFNLGKIHLTTAFYSFLLELENGDGVDIEYKEKYAPLEYRSLEFIIGLSYKD